MRRATYSIFPPKLTRASGTCSTSSFCPGSTIPLSPYSSSLSKPGPGTFTAFQSLFLSLNLFLRRLTEYKDTFKLFIITLDPLTRSYPVITGVEGLPYDCLSLLACPASVGGVLVLTANALLYIDRSSRRLALPLNGWPARTSEGAFAPPPREHEDRMLALEGARMAFGGDERTVLLVLRDGAVHTLELTLEGRVVVGFTLGDAVVRTAVPAVVSNVGKEHVFIGSTVGESALLKTVRVEEEVVDEVAPVAAAVEEDMELDDEDEGEVAFRTTLNIKFPNVVYAQKYMARPNQLKLLEPMAWRRNPLLRG